MTILLVGTYSLFSALPALFVELELESLLARPAQLEPRREPG